MNDTIQFDETTHKYTKNNSNYISVTTLLKQYGLSANYTNIPADVLQKAAQRGTATHKAFENYIKSNGVVIPQAPDFGSIEVPQLHAYVVNRNIDLTQSQSEQIIYDDNYLIAGMLDWLYYDNNEKIIADFKTTSSIHSDAVSWQLSIYNYIISKGDLIEYYSTKLMVLHFYQGKFSVREMPAIDYQEVVSLLEAYKTNSPYTYVANTSMIVSTSEATVLETLLREIDNYESVLLQLKNKYNSFVKPITERMKNNLRKDIVINNCIKINLSNATTRKTFDTKLFEQFCIDNGIDKNKFYKQSPVKESLKCILLH